MRSCHAEAPPTTTVHAERRTRWVVLLTFAMMFGELIVGSMTKSLALVADGWHMATHAGALGLAAGAYWYARTRSGTATFAFGTGKVLALTAFANAVVLILVALLMGAEAITRLRHPEKVLFNEALPVAVLGLLVNLLSFVLLHPADHEHGHEHDVNRRAAYLHVAADALTSVLAIVALLGGRSFGWTFLDPMMALVGAAIILRWAYGLVGQSAGQLLDMTPSTRDATAIREAIEKSGASVCDLHLWEAGPLHRVCVLTIAADDGRTVAEWRAVVLRAARVDHLTIELEELPPSSRATF